MRQASTKQDKNEATNTSLVPRLPCSRTRIREERYLFSREHDVIEIGPEFIEQKGNVRVLFNQLCSTLGVYDIHSLIARYV